MKHKDVAYRYDGDEHRINTTVKQAVSVAVGLSMKTIKSVASVFNTENVDIILRSSNLNSYSFKPERDKMEHEGCHLFNTSVYLVHCMEPRTLYPL